MECKTVHLRHDGELYVKMELAIYVTVEFQINFSGCWA